MYHMKELPTRLFYDESDGEILSIEYGYRGAVNDRKEAEVVRVLDIPNSTFNPMKQRIVRVENGKAIFEDLPIVETDEQKRIRELEDALLLAADNELGGIL